MQFTLFNAKIKEKFNGYFQARMILILDLFFEEIQFIAKHSAHNNETQKITF